MGYVELLREELILKIRKAGLDKNKSIRIFLKDEIAKTLKKKSAIYLGGFIKEEIGNKAVLNSLSFYRFGEGTVDEDSKTILMFLLKGSNASADTYDYYALSLGHSGYLAFKQFCDDNYPNNKDVFKEKTINPIDESEELKKFFKNESYLYVYDDNLTEPKDDTDPVKILEPTLDAIVLKYDKKIEKFNILNLPEKEGYYGGSISWTNKKKCAIKIKFLNETRELVLMVQVPKQVKRSEKIEILLGSFILSTIGGEIATGSIALRCKDNNGNHPYTYCYKKNEAYIVKSDKGERIIKDNNPNKVVREYFFDRGLNWHKVPSGIRTFDDINSFLTKQRGKDFLKKEPKEQAFLLMFPVSSFSKDGDNVELPQKLYQEIKKNIINYDVDKEIPQFLIDYKKYNNKYFEIEFSVLREKLLKMYKEQRISLYPDFNFRQFIKGKSNVEELFPRLNRTKNVVLIIPRDTDKRISSLYVVAGYSIAMKLSTFIFYQDIKLLPKNLRSPEKALNLYVHRYENLNEIPVLIVQGEKYKKRWENHWNKSKNQ